MTQQLYCAPHEPILKSRRVQASSERSFGLLFAAVFLLVAFIPWLFAGKALYVWALPTAALFLILALARPQTLSPLNRLWQKLGLAMHKVVNPVILGIIYFGTVLPTGMLLKIFGKDPLRLKRDPQCKSYWIVRQPSGLLPGSMTNQY